MFLALNYDIIISLNMVEETFKYTIYYNIDGTILHNPSEILVITLFQRDCNTFKGYS